MKIMIINGPNLNLLGTRQVDIYGSKSFEDFFEELKALYPEHELEYYQSNHEGELVDKIQKCDFFYAGIVLNAAAYTHTSVAITDAVSSIDTPVIEVHISNPYAREAFRHTSLISANAKAVIAGMGLDGYRVAIDHILNLSTDKDQ